MKIHLIERDDILEQINEYNIKLKDTCDFTSGDYLILDEGDYMSYYTVDYLKNQAKKSRPIVNGLCELQNFIFREFTVTYNEINDISNTLKLYPKYSKDDIEKEIFTVLERLKLQEKITEEQETVLSDLFEGKVTKSDLIFKKGYSMEYINKAYNVFTHHIEYCYPLKQKSIYEAVKHRISDFNSGELALKWNPISFAKHYNITYYSVMYIICSYIGLCLDIEEYERVRCVTMLRDLKENETVSAADFPFVLDVFNRAKRNYVSKRDKYYEEYADWYVSKYGKDLLTKMDICARARFDGLVAYGLERALRKKGHSIRTHNNRRFYEKGD